MAHPSWEVSSFVAEGETRLVFARFRDNPTSPLFYLPQGEAEACRQLVKDELECPMPTCTDRLLSVVNRSPKRRDGFRHRAGAGGHAPESVDHLQGKALVLRWLARLQLQQRLDAGVTYEPEVVVGGGARVADILVTWPSGDRLAIEIQYAALSRRELEARTASYADHGIACVWLLGHRAPHFRSTRGLVSLGELHHQLIRQGQPLIWINPEEAKVGTGFVREPTPTLFGTPAPPGSKIYARRPREDDMKAEFYGSEIEDCDLSPEGMVLPSVERIDRASDELAEVRRNVEDKRASLQKLGTSTPKKRRKPTNPIYPRWTPAARPPSRPIRANGRFACYVCSEPLSEEFAHLGGHPGGCIAVELVTAETEPSPPPGSDQLALFED